MWQIQFICLESEYSLISFILWGQLYKDIHRIVIFTTISDPRNLQITET